MGRTREAALTGAVGAIAKYGSRKATMGDIAMLAGIAKATLYNHFRTRDEVYRAALSAEVDAIAAAAMLRRDGGFEAVLDEAARLLAEHPAARRVALDEPALLARLVTIGTDGPWANVHELIGAALRGTGFPASGPAVTLVLRYLVTQLAAPSGPAERRDEVRLVTAAVASSVPMTVPNDPVGADSADGEHSLSAPAEEPLAPAAPTPSAAEPARAGSSGTSS